MRRELLTRRWLLIHALLVVGVAACLALGWWQWDRAHEGTGHAWQNYLYAVQWPSFGIFAVYAWLRAMRLQLHPPAPRYRPQLSGLIDTWAGNRALTDRPDRPELAAADDGGAPPPDPALGDGRPVRALPAAQPPAHTVPIGPTGSTESTEDTGTTGDTGPTTTPESAADTELAEYNRYLASLYGRSPRKDGR